MNASDNDESKFIHEVLINIRHSYEKSEYSSVARGDGMVYLHPQTQTSVAPNINEFPYFASSFFIMINFYEKIANSHPLPQVNFWLHIG